MPSTLLRVKMILRPGDHAATVLSPVRVKRRSPPPPAFTTYTSSVYSPPLVNHLVNAMCFPSGDQYGPPTLRVSRFFPVPSDFMTKMPSSLAYAIRRPSGDH